MTYSEAYEKALQLLNVRFLSEGELRTKLRRRDVRDDVIDEVMAMLKEEHFIDDDRLARQVYAYYVRKKQYGHLYIANCLRRRQLMVPDDIERLMNTLGRNLAERKFSRRHDEKRKAARYLQYRGFSPSVIAEVIASFTVGDEG